jgi:hypothetical protein
MKKAALYLCYISFIIMILYQIYSIENAKHKLLYISLLSLCIVAFIYEGQYLGCSPNNCTLEQNEKALNNKNGESVACQETKRVNWRICSLSY